MHICKKFKSHMRASLLALVLMVAPIMAHSSGAIMGAIEPTALLSNFELVDIAIKDAQQLATTIKQYEIMAQNLEGLPDYIKQKALSDLQDLSKIVQQGNALAYSSGQLDNQYREQYRDFNFYVQQQGTSYQSDNERYQDWSSNSHNSIRGALRAANLQSSQFITETQTLRSIENQAATAKGEMQILQAGASISAQQVEQLQKLRQLIMAQMQMQSAYTSNQIDRQTQADANWERKKQKNTITFDPDKVAPPLTANNLFN
jgi:type IV secretion system protein TrbJ